MSLNPARPHQTLAQICDEGLKTLAYQVQVQLKDSGLMTPEEIIHDLQHMGYASVANECAAEWGMEA